MKKATLQFIATYLFDNVQYADDIEKSALESALSEINAELNKGKEKKDATATAYVEMWEKVHQALTDATAPVTAQEIADETGLTRGKIVYGLTNYWANEVVKGTSGKSTTYALKA